MDLPNTVRFIRLGTKSSWVTASGINSTENATVHAGWNDFDRRALLTNDPTYLCPTGRRKGKSLHADSELQYLLDKPSQHVWVTTYNGHLWWTLVEDGIHFTSGESKSQGNFYLQGTRPWSNLSLSVPPKTLHLESMPGTVGVVAGFQGTCCKPQYEGAILRSICGTLTDGAHNFEAARANYISAVSSLIGDLHWRDLEGLVDLIFSRAGFLRVSRTGGTMEAVDIELEHPELGEIVTVQVKASFTPGQVAAFAASQSRKTDKLPRKLYFATSSEQIPESPGVEGWNRMALAERVVRRGLADWVAARAMR